MKYRITAPCNMSLYRKYIEKTRRECWELIDQRYPEPKDKHTIVKELVERTVSPGVIILDAGCGHKSITRDCVQATRIGVDRIQDDVRKNDSISFGVCSSLESLPLKDDSVDVVVSCMVFEHLRQPDVVFSEFRRVLKKGGSLIFSTPNIFNIVTAINRMIPNRLHPDIANTLVGAKESDVFPSYYRANSVGRLRKLLTQEGFRECDLILYQPPPYAFVFSLTICKLAVRYFGFINRHDALKQLRGVIISRYIKS